MRITICDLDGTICDDRHRLHLIKSYGSFRYDAYHAQCDHDALMNAGCIVDPKHTAIFTGRPESVHARTWTWLARHNITPWRLQMRPDCDTSSSAPELKQRMLYALFGCVFAQTRGNCEIVAYDDRDDVLAMYRRHGIQTVKVGYDTP